MFYAKNVPNRERVARIIVGLLVVAFGLAKVGGLIGGLIAISAAGIVVSGLVGFCPACALVGRRLDKARKHGTV
jgi:hypothetical protein